MAETAKQFRDAERRKMRLQAMLSAKRASLMTMGNAGSIPRPDDLPGRAEADASFRQNQADILGTPGINLNAENARRIAATVALNNTLRPSRIADANARLLPESGFSQGALDSLYEDQAAAQQASVPAQVSAPTVVGGIPVHPGAKNAGVAGNRSWLGQYLPDSWRQRNFNRQAIDEQTHGEGQRFQGGGTSPWTTSQSTPRSASQGMTGSMGVASPQKRIKTNSEHLTDRIKLIAKRKAIIAGSAAVFGNAGDGRKAAERYEAKALANLGIYAGKYALSNLDDSDFQSKQKLFQALVEGGLMPLDQILKVVDSGVVMTQDVAKPDRFKRKETDEDGKTWDITEQWNPKTGTMDFISKAEVRTTPLVQMIPGEAEGTKASAKKFAETYSALVDDPDRTYANLKSENDRIRQLETAIERGMPTGFGTAPMLDFQRFVLKMIPPVLKENSEFFDTWKENIGTQEWWQATSERFIGGMLAMTAGSVSDREMKIFMGMIPSLSTTPAGNRKLLRMMYEMNSLALVDHLAAKELNKWLADNDMSGLGQLGTPKAREKLEEFRQKQEKLARARFNEAMKPDTVEEAALQIKALNSWMTSERAMEEAVKVFK